LGGGASDGRVGGGTREERYAKVGRGGRRENTGLLCHGLKFPFGKLTQQKKKTDGKKNWVIRLWKRKNQEVGNVEDVLGG